MFEHIEFDPERLRSWLRIVLVAVAAMAAPGCGGRVIVEDDSRDATSGDALPATSGNSTGAGGSSAGQGATSSDIPPSKGGFAATGGGRGFNGTSPDASLDGGGTMSRVDAAQDAGGGADSGCTRGHCSGGCIDTAQCPGESQQCVDGFCQAAKIVFLSSRVLAADLGGVAGADAVCNDMARQAGLKGTYRAWLSEFSSSPAKRFTRSLIPYRLVTGAMVAASWDDLTDGQIDVPIDVTELGGPPNSWDAGADCHGPPDCTTVFTSTAADGTALLQMHREACYDWTSVEDFQGSGAMFTGGVITSTTDHWTIDAAGFGCNLRARIYCFQQ